METHAYIDRVIVNKTLNFQRTNNVRPITKHQHYSVLSGRSTKHAVIRHALFPAEGLQMVCMTLQQFTVTSDVSGDPVKITSLPRPL